MTDAEKRALLSGLHVTVLQYAEIFGIGRKAAYALANSGGIPCIRVGRQLRIPTAPLRRILEIADGEAAAVPRKTG